MSRERDVFLQDLFTTALEGGIGYWSQAETYHWSDEDPTSFYADIIDNEDDNESYHIDRAVIVRGLALCLEGCKYGPEGRPRADLMLAAATNGEDGDYDSDVADCVVQAGLFGEVVYG
ncbi:MAG: hypothetical protein V4510_12710 [bacterium]